MPRTPVASEFACIKAMPQAQQKDRPKAVSLARISAENLRSDHSSAPQSDQSAESHDKPGQPSADNRAGDSCRHFKCYRVYAATFAAWVGRLLGDTVDAVSVNPIPKASVPNGVEMLTGTDAVNEIPPKSTRVGLPGKYSRLFSQVMWPKSRMKVVGHWSAK